MSWFYIGAMIASILFCILGHSSVRRKMAALSGLERKEGEE